MEGCCEIYGIVGIDYSDVVSIFYRCWIGVICNIVVWKEVCIFMFLGFFFFKISKFKEYCNYMSVLLE